MKWINGFFIFLFCFFLSTQSFSFEGYDYTPMDSGYSNYEDNNYYDNNSDNDNNDNYYSNANYSKKSASQYSTKKMGRSFSGPGKAFVFDPKQLRWFAFYNGNLINSGRASGGRFYCADIRRPCKTPVGVFSIGHKGGPECKSSKYPIGRGNAPMPWCMFFHKGFAIHGSWAVPNFNASHGCIRVPPSDARWLNRQFLNPGTKVVVKSYH